MKGFPPLGRIIGERPFKEQDVFYETEGIIMKKTIAKAGAIAMALAIAAGTAVGASAYCGGGRYYSDSNGDGICDYCGNYNCGGHGRYYVDADGDGVCDNYGSGMHHGGGRHGRCGR